MIRLILLLLCLGALPVAGADAPAVNFAENAVLRAGNVTVGPMVYDRKWNAFSPKKIDSADRASFEAAWNPAPGLDFTLAGTLEAVSEREWDVAWTLSSAKPAPAQLACLSLTLPAAMGGKELTVGEKKILLPEQPRPGRIAAGETDYLSWETDSAGIALSGKLRYELRDTRKGNAGDFRLRLLFAPEGKEFSTATVAFTLSSPALPRRIPGTYPVADAGKYRDAGWRDSLSTAPGSALDLSFLQDAPAGKHGRLLVRNGHFEFAGRPGTPVRLYGVNLCFDTLYQEKEAAERLADELARTGYNAVRIHHYDGMLTEGAATSADLNPERLDRLDYLAACLKKRGLYLAIDLYCSRSLRPGEIPAHPELTGRALKTMAAIDASAMDNWKRFVRNLLTHRNPYTGLSWGDDPELAICSLVNEDPLFNSWEKTPEIKAAFERKFAEMEREKGLPPVSGDLLLQRRAEFLAELQNRCYGEMRAFLKNELKCGILVSGVNFKNSEAQSFIREELDYVDNHSYFNHPSFPEKAYSYPVKFRSKSPLALRLPAIRDVGHARIFGKPFTITETNYVYPNSFRSVGGAVLGAFGGYQDYDGIFRFAWSHRASKLESPVTISYFDIVQDPVNRLSERIGILLFLRNEVRPSQKRFVWLYDKSAYQAFRDFGREAGRFPGSFNELALLGQIGSARRERQGEFPKADTRFYLSKLASPLPGAAAWPDGRSLEAAFRTSPLAADTGQIRLVPKRNSLAVITPRSEFFAMEAAAADSGPVMTVENGSEGFGSFFLSSVDGAKPLGEANRLLLLFLSDVQNSGIAFDDAENTVLRNWGKLPLELRRGTARISLRLPGDYRIFALNPDGSRGAELAAARSGERLELSLDNFRNGGTLAWELSRKE